MTVQEQLEQLVGTMPEADRRFLLEMARFLSLGGGHEGWQRFGMEHFARAYGDDEPEYTEADVKPELSR